MRSELAIPGSFGIAVLVLGVAAPAAGGQPLARWRVEVDLGYTHPEGDDAQAFGGGFDNGWTFGRRFGAVVADAGVRVASMSYRAAATVPAVVCEPAGRTPAVCTSQPTKQRGGRTAATLGLSVPLWTGSDGRGVEIGAGGLLERTDVTPAGDATGSRSSPGTYLRLAGDVARLGRVAALGVTLRGSWAYGRGASLAALPPRTHDVWLDLNLVFRIGSARVR